MRSRTIDADDDPTEDNLDDIVSEVYIVEDKIRGCVVSLLLVEDVVINIKREFGRISGVSVSSLDLSNQV